MDGKLRARASPATLQDKEIVSSKQRGPDRPKGVLKKIIGTPGSINHREQIRIKGKVVEVGRFGSVCIVCE